MYRLIRPLLYLLPAEFAHHLSFGVLRFVSAIPPVAWLLRRLFVVDDPALVTRAMGLTFRNPVGLAAGFDKDAVGYRALANLGFGFVEVGTLTAQPQPGNPKPRMFRLVRDSALINRMGFNNGGAAAAAKRLTGSRLGPVGVNIGKTKVVPEEQAVNDYIDSTCQLADRADYFVVNVSSPNTPGLRNLQAVEKLRPLLVAVRAELDRVRPAAKDRVPLLVKIAPDLSDDDVDAVADLALELDLDGIIATNTTISREGLNTPEMKVKSIGGGGLSGIPVNHRALEVLRRLRARVGDRLVLISVGGIFTASDAWDRITAGATLVQVYTGFVYGGPGMPARLARGLRHLARRNGYKTVQAAVGRDAAD